MKKLILMLCSITIISCGEKKQNENTLNKTENHFGTIEKGDQKSLAAQSFSKAYIANNLASVSGLFTEDAKIMINDSDITFDQLVAGFSEGFKYYENIHHMDTDTYTMYYDDDEILVIASERPAIQTVFNLTFDKIKEVPPGHAIINKKSGDVEIKEIITPLEKRSCSFERIYFSRGGDAEIYKERKKLGRFLFPAVFDSINGDIENTVFSFIPNTAETSFYGMIGAVQDYLRIELTQGLEKIKKSNNLDSLKKMLQLRPRIEKIAIKDAKLRTFITQDSSRDDLVAHVYDITYGIIKKTDNLVIIDDSIVRGTTLEKSILRMLDRLEPKKIIIVSSAPQIRYPDCYGIDMAKLDQFIAFKACVELHKDKGTYNSVVKEIYNKCVDGFKENVSEKKNNVKDFYRPFSNQEISRKIADILKINKINAELDVIFQEVNSLHKACPDNIGDWYFTGDYPTPGGNRVVNRAFINFYEGKSQRAY